MVHVLAELIGRLVNTRRVEKDDLAALVVIDRLDTATGRLWLLRGDGDLLADHVIHQG